MLNPTNTTTRDDTPLDSLVAGVVDEFRERLQRGEQPDIEEYAARHPEATPLMRKVLASLQWLDFSPLPLGEGSGVRGLAPDARLTGTLGDFRLIREVGRGGMGIVYEAEQISLGRRVALKVLPFAATLDPRQLQRFHNEARAAASLHHEHIVPVYAVGQERGIHFFAMQFIEGQTLAQIIHQQKQPATIAAHDAPTMGSPAADTAPIAGKTSTPPRDTAQFQRIAEWGIQAANALEHAHTLGIVHRDIKPGNLMIDAHGQLWIADFGLARRAADSNLTMSGDLLGTLRYMSPEQALAKHDLVDHHSDIYSLGATLYELLTLQYAVEGSDSEEILQRLMQSDPTNPRQFNRDIPRDLETIVLKALAKEPEARYGSAREFADDLQRFLEVRPILAKRPTWTNRLARWSRRHLGLVASTLAFLVVGAIALSVMLVVLSIALNDRDEAIQAQKKTLGEKEQALKEKTEAIGQKETALAQAKQNEIEATKNAEAAVKEWLKAQEDFQSLSHLVAPLENSIKALREAGKDKEAQMAVQAAVTILERYLDSVLRVAPELKLIAPEQRAKANTVFLTNLAKYERIMDMCNNLGEQARTAELAGKLAVFFDTIDPKDGRYGETARVTRAVAFDQQASALRALGQAAAAEKACQNMEMAWRRVGEQADYLRDLSISWRIPALSRLGELQLDQRKYQEAEASLQAALDLAAAPPAYVYKTIGELHWEQGQFEKANAAHEKVLAENRPNATLLEFLLTCPDVKLRDPARASKILDVLQKKQRSWENPHREWAGVVEYRLGFHQKALDLYAKDSSFVSPVEQQIRNCVTAMAMARLGKTKEAQQILERTKKEIAEKNIQHYLVRQFVREAEQVLAASTKQ
jgi:serine/threonine protein kinase